MAERHDQVVAVISHVPHLTAATLMGLASDRGEEHAALLRLAAGVERPSAGRILIAERDVTPQVTGELLTLALPGVVDAVLRHGAQHVPTAVLSRAQAGIVRTKKGTAFVVNAPGSTGGVTDTVAVVGPLISHVLDQLDGKDHVRVD